MRVVLWAYVCFACGVSLCPKNLKSLHGIRMQGVLVQLTSRYLFFIIVLTEQGIKNAANITHFYFPLKEHHEHR